MKERPEDFARKSREIKLGTVKELLRIKATNFDKISGSNILNF